VAVSRNYEVMLGQVQNSAVLCSVIIFVSCYLVIVLSKVF
jgi:hypothetical protein